MIGSIPWLQSPLNFYMSAVSICYGCSQISGLLHPFNLSLCCDCFLHAGLETWPKNWNMVKANRRHKPGCVQVILQLYQQTVVCRICCVRNFWCWTFKLFFFFTLIRPVANICTARLSVKWDCSMSTLFLCGVLRVLRMNVDYFPKRNFIGDDPSFLGSSNRFVNFVSWRAKLWSKDTVELGYNVMKGTEYVCRYKRVLL
jgi:hypothetical protein